MLYTKFTFTGLQELDEALKELPKATGKNCLKRAMTDAGWVIALYAKALAPIKRGDLKKNIGVSKIKFTGGAAGKAAFAQAMTEGATRQEAGQAARAANAGEAGNITAAVIVVGPGQSRYAGMQEFGTVNHRAKPYMRPAWDSKRQEALEIIKFNLAIEIEKAAKRLERKAARLLTKSVR